LRAALAEIFSSMGIETEKTWCLAAQVRVLLLLEDSPLNSVNSENFWQDPDVRWLSGINIAEGITYLNKELFEELECWIQLPALLACAESSLTDLEPLRTIESDVAKALSTASDGGYKLEQFLSSVTTSKGAEN
jgi:hypothetical protein